MNVIRRLLAGIARITRDGAWVIAASSLAHPLIVTALILTLVLITQVPTLYWLATVLAMILISIAGGDATVVASSLVDQVKYAYRRVFIWWTFRTMCLQAGLYKTVHHEDVGLGHKHAGDRITPHLYRYGRKRMRKLPLGMSVVVDGTKAGYGHEGFEGETLTVMKAKFRARDIIVGPHPRWPWLTSLQLIFGDPFAKIITPASLPASTKAWHVVVGLDSMGHPVLKDLRLPHLIAGGKGAGKSTECWRILQALVELLIPFRVRCFDPKGGMEFIDLRDKAYYYESNPTQWARFLEAALHAVACRMDALSKAGLKKCPFNDPRFPLDVMVIDELLTVIAMMKGKKIKVGGVEVPAMEAFMVFLSTCRAAGFTVIACTQLTQKEALGIIRDLFDYVTCLRVASPEMVRAVLGDANLYPAHEIPADDEHSGIGFMVTNQGAIKYRSAWVDDSDGTRAKVADGVGWWTLKLKEDLTSVDLDVLAYEAKIGASIVELADERAADEESATSGAEQSTGEREVIPAQRESDNGKVSV
jgi:hypothetical protein